GRAAGGAADRIPRATARGRLRSRDRRPSRRPTRPGRAAPAGAARARPGGGSPGARQPAGGGDPDWGGSHRPSGPPAAPVLIGPPATARLVTRRVPSMLAVAVLLAIGCGLAGLEASYQLSTASGA